MMLPAVKCVICKHGDTGPGVVTITLERGAATVVFKSVPASVCDNCGERDVDDSTTTSLLDAFDAAADQGVLMDVRQFTHA